MNIDFSPPGIHGLAYKNIRPHASEVILKDIVKPIDAELQLKLQQKQRSAKYVHAPWDLLVFHHPEQKLTYIVAWLSNYLISLICDLITWSYPNLAAVWINRRYRWAWISNYISYRFKWYSYLSLSLLHHWFTQSLPRPHSSDMWARIFRSSYNLTCLDYFTFCGQFMLTTPFTLTALGWTQKIDLSSKTCFLFYLFQIYLYRVDHSVRLFFHGALLQNKIYIQNDIYIYTHK